MWRYLVGGVAAMLLTTAGFLWFGGRAAPSAVLPLAGSAGAAQTAEPLPDAAPEASDRTREQKRFDRYDKDRDGKVTREEYLAARRKAFAKLDVNHDGRLDFDEWAVKTLTKFSDADGDKSGAMTPAEFAKTAPKRKAKVRARCPENQQQEGPREEES